MPCVKSKKKLGYVCDPKQADLSEPLTEILDAAKLRTYVAYIIYGSSPIPCLVTHKHLSGFRIFLDDQGDRIDNNTLDFIT